jgi:hypothetical protein
MSNLTESDFAALADREERKDRRRAEDRWRIDKTVSPSIIVTIVTFIVTGTMAYADLKRSDDLIKADNASLHTLFSHMESQEEATLAQITAQYKDLNAKVDRLIERQIPRPGSK